jgi:2-C-methyl-D-erythritol 4-phosphate cytidylyltransferase
LSGTWAILVAAGRGERLGAERPKAFVAFNGRPLLAESLSRLDASEHVDSVVVVAPPGWEEPAILCAEEESAGKVVVCVAGGETRADSVRAGVAEVAASAEIILVHDAARPLVTDDVIARVVAALADEGVDGAVPGLPIPDTVKQASGDLVERTIPRDDLVAVQTPQGFRASVFRNVLAESQAPATDCAGLLEAAGRRVRIVSGDWRLTKVTTQADLAVVERLARQ